MSLRRSDSSVNDDLLEALFLVSHHFCKTICCRNRCRQGTRGLFFLNHQIDGLFLPQGGADFSLFIVVRGYKFTDPIGIVGDARQRGKDQGPLSGLAFDPDSRPLFRHSLNPLRFERFGEDDRQHQDQESGPKNSGSSGGLDSPQPSLRCGSRRDPLMNTQKAFCNPITGDEKKR